MISFVEKIGKKEFAKEGCSCRGIKYIFCRGADFLLNGLDNYHQLTVLRNENLVYESLGHF